MKTPDAVAITASTGIAACNIGGVTIHSFAGIGLGLESAEDLVVRVKKNKKASGRWLRTKVLIIDEGVSLVLGFRIQLKPNDMLSVSMVDGDLFDKLSQIGSSIRKKEEPFGGIQVCVCGTGCPIRSIYWVLQIIVTGDFFQLPPVTKGGDVKFAFEATLWKKTIQRTFNLTKVFRQRDQGIFCPTYPMVPLADCDL